MTKSILGIAMGLALTTNAFAFGNTDHWVRESGKGWQEATILNDDGAALLVSCSNIDAIVIRYTDPDGRVVENDSGDAVMFMFDDDDTPGDAIGVAETGAMYGLRDLSAVMDALRTNNTVTAFGLDQQGKTNTTASSFTLKGSSKALPTICNAAMDIN